MRHSGVRRDQRKSAAAPHAPSRHPFRHVDAVLFDLDGTLVDTTELILASHEHTLRRHLTSGAPRRDTLIRDFGRSLPATLREYALADGAADAATAAERMLETYRAYQRLHHDRLIRPFGGVREVLHELSHRGYLLGVVTSKMEATARLALDAYGLGPFLAVSVFHDDTSRHKPDPDPLLEAARKGGLEVGRTVYVGDSVHDVAAGKAAGMRTIAALWGPFDHAHLNAAGPDDVAASPSDLLTILGPR